MSKEFYGIDYSKNTQKLREKLYDGGRYFTGLGHKFIEFPRNQLVFVFSDDYTG